MTRNKIIDALRKISSNEKLKDQIWRFMQTENNDNAEKIEAKELQEILTKAIEDLPPKRKQIYLLKNEEGKSYQDIAEKMNISQHTVKNQLSSAVGAIRLFISQQFRDFSVFLISFFFYN
jgi:RNA polymerase sigma-70 factor (ECF subfamily)